MRRLKPRIERDTPHNMIRAVFDANILVSAFLSREHPGGVSNELLRFGRERVIELLLSPEIVGEALTILLTSQRLRDRYLYTGSAAVAFFDDLRDVITPVIDPQPTPGAVPRDPDDDKIIACAVAANAEYLVSRDRDLLSLANFAGIAIVSPEAFLHIVRARQSPTS